MIRLLTAYFLPGRALALCLLASLLCSCAVHRPLITQSVKDSSNVKTVKKDSSVYTNTVETKTIPESNIDLILWNVLNQQADHKSALDSIARALKNLPKGVPQIITIPDKKGLAQMQFRIDSLGNFVLQCTSLQKQYQEQHEKDVHLISTLTLALTEKNKDTNTEKTIDNRGFWDKLNWKAQALIYFIVFGFIVMIYRAITGQLTKISVVTSIASLFTRRKPPNA